jgi:hypothetical protein
MKDAFICSLPLSGVRAIARPPIPDSRLLLLYKRFGFSATAQKKRQCPAITYIFDFLVFQRHEHRDCFSTDFVGRKTMQWKHGIAFSMPNGVLIQLPANIGGNHFIVGQSSENRKKWLLR